MFRLNVGLIVSGNAVDCTVEGTPSVPPAPQPPSHTHTQRQTQTQTHKHEQYCENIFFFIQLYPTLNYCQWIVQKAHFLRLDPQNL